MIPRFNSCWKCFEAEFQLQFPVPTISAFFDETKPDKLQTEKLLMLCKSGIALKCSLWHIPNVLDIRSNVFYMDNHYVGWVFSLYDERLLVGIVILLFSPFGNYNCEKKLNIDYCVIKINHNTIELSHQLSISWISYHHQYKLKIIIRQWEQFWEC